MPEDPILTKSSQAPHRVSRLMKALRIEGRWSQLCVCLLGIHILWGALRIPGKVYGKRLKQIRRYQEVGGARFHLDNEHRQGADQLRIVLSDTPPDSILLWRGAWQGAVEFVPALIAPRLLVTEAACPANATHMFGRPLAQGRLTDGRRGVFVLVSGVDHISLELR